MYELYGETRNEAVRDFDAFIQDKPYKADLLSLDCKTYDEAMAKFLLQGIDDCHTTIGTTSIYDLPTMANGNAYSSALEGPRYDAMTSLASKLRGERADAGVSEGLDIVGETAFLTFDKFAFDRAANGVLSLKGFKEYKGTDPKSYVQNNTMEFFASSFNKIAENAAVKNDVPPEELPAKLYIISDMEFNSCVRNAKKTVFENAANAYAAHGYALPQIVFWNVAARNAHLPVTQNEKGVKLVSGASAAIFEDVVSGDLKSMTPYDFMLQMLEPYSEFDKIRIA